MSASNDIDKASDQHGSPAHSLSKHHQSSAHRLNHHIIKKSANELSPAHNARRPVVNIRYTNYGNDFCLIIPRYHGRSKLIQHVLHNPARGPLLTRQSHHGSNDSICQLGSYIQCALKVYTDVSFVEWNAWIQWDYWPPYGSQRPVICLTLCSTW